MFSAIGHDVYVFYSPETFVCSGAAASVDILILGLTRMRLAENETLRWVGTYRPKIKTIVLGRVQLSSIDCPTCFMRPQSPPCTKSP
jgi:hypothetical protein